MNKKIILVRHGMTKGNIEKRYVGSTNEDILDSEKSCYIMFLYLNAEVFLKII